MAERRIGAAHTHSLCGAMQLRVSKSTPSWGLPACLLLALLIMHRQPLVTHSHPGSYSHPPPPTSPATPPATYRPRPPSVLRFTRMVGLAGVQRGGDAYRAASDSHCHVGCMTCLPACLPACLQTTPRSGRPAGTTSTCPAFTSGPSASQPVRCAKAL